MENRSDILDAPQGPEKRRWLTSRVIMVTGLAVFILGAGLIFYWYNFGFPQDGDAFRTGHVQEPPPEWLFWLLKLGVLLSGIGAVGSWFSRDRENLFIRIVRLLASVAVLLFVADQLYVAYLLFYR